MPPLRLGRHSAQREGGSRGSVASLRRDFSRGLIPAEVGDELLAAQVAERVLQLHELNEQVVLRIQSRSGHRALEVERQPLLNAAHPGALRQIQEERDVEHDWRRQNAVAAEEVDLELHGTPSHPNRSMLSHPSLLSPRGG